MQILYKASMKSRHDHFNPDCKKGEPDSLAAHSNGTHYYRCKNCNYFGTIESFTEAFRTSEMAQQH